jgi:hypothetical protein
MKDTRGKQEELVALHLNNTIETAISLITILPQNNILKVPQICTLLRYI